MPDLEEIRRLSPRALDIFKKQAYERARSGDQDYVRLVGSPEYQSMFQEPNLLEKVTAPFRWISENITEPFSAAVHSPFTPSIKGTENLPWMQREMAEYRGWENEPKVRIPGTEWDIGTKGIVETLPWLAAPTAGGIVGKLGGIAAKGGATGKAAQIGATALKPVAAVEAIPGKMIRGAIKSVIPTKVTSLMPDLQDFGQTIDIASRPDTLRKLANTKPFEGISRVLGGKAATMKTPTEKAIVGRQILLGEGETKTVATMARLKQMGNQDAVFGKVGADGKFSTGEAQGVLQNELFTYPGKYLSKLNPVQRQWIQIAREIDTAKLDFLKRNGIKVNELKFEDGGVYAGQRVAGKFNKEGILEDIAYISPGARKPGSKAPFLKTRIFDDPEEAAKLGYRYLTRDEALSLNVQAAYNTVANKKMTDWLLKNISWRSAEVFTLPKAGRLVDDALMRTPIRQRSLDALARDMPEIAERLGLILAEKNWDARFQMLTGLKSELKAMVPTAKDKLFWASERLAASRKTAEKSIEVIQRALRGETIPTGTVKAIGKIFPEIKAQLREKTRFVLDDLIKAGTEAGKYPITLETGPAMGKIKAYKKLLEDAERALAGDPKNPKLFREVQTLKRKVAFTKYRIAKGEPIDLEKSPVSILTSDRKEALTEMLDMIRGTPYKGKTATGKPVTKYTGGALVEMRIKETQAVALRRKVTEDARRVKYGEATVQAPAFQGKILTGEDAPKIAEQLNKEFSPQYSEALAAVNRVNAVGRYFALTGDASPFGIQLIFMPWTNPKAFGESVKGFVNAFKDKNFLSSYIARNADVVNDSPGLLISTFEPTEAMRSAGIMANIPVVKSIFEPFTRAYDAAMTVAGIEMKKALKHLATTPERAADVDAFINEFRGVISTARLGVSMTQRQAESALVLAPKYNRAVAALLVDTFRGGLRGSLARDAMIKTSVGMLAMTVGLSLALGEDEEDIAEHLDPRSPRFMTWRIAGQNVGPGSKMRSILKLIGSSTKNPEDLLSASMDNPGLRFVRGNLSPGVSTGIDLLTGRDYVGDPTRDGMLSLTKHVIGENMVPVWLQSVIWEGGDLEERGARGAVEFAGWRAYPLTPYQELEEARNKVAQEKYGMDWDSVGLNRGKLYQLQLEKTNPELARLKDVAQKESSKMATGESLVWNQWNALGQDIENRYRGKIDLANKEFEQKWDGVTFRKKVEDAKLVRREMHEQRQNQPEFEVIMQYFNQPPTKEVNPLDAARSEYYRVMYNPDDMYDQFGNYQFDLAELKEEQFATKYGQQALDYVQEFGNARWEKPQALVALERAKGVLEPYWQVADQMWSQFPPELKQITDQIAMVEQSDPATAKRMLFMYPQIVWIRKQIALMRRQIKAANPDIAQALVTFY